jgi:hypothetical protein
MRLMNFISENHTSIAVSTAQRRISSSTMLPDAAASAG